MIITNLTPHTITFISANDNMQKYELAPSGVVARVAAHTETIGEITTPEGFVIPVTQTVFGQVENLPEPEKDTIYVV